MKKPIRYVMYVVILIICITSICIAIFNMETKLGKTENIVVGEEEDVEEISTLEKFKRLFDNNVHNMDSADKLVKKIDNQKPIVYESDFSEKQEGKYSIDVHLPTININSEVTNKYNSATQNFANKVVKMKEQAQTLAYTIYETSFTGFVNNEILSVVILASLKQGDSAQRLFVETYNYNFATGKEVTISDIIENRGLDTTAINKKINSEIRKIQQSSESLVQTGYSVYKRNLQSEIYNIRNTSNFIQGPDGELYVIYAYGNTNNTSELDVVEI